MVSPKFKSNRKIKSPARTSKYRFAVSACLAGINCTFKGKNNLSKKIRKLFDAGAALAVCPEIAGGMGTPRDRSEICGGGGLEVLQGSARVLSSSGEDNTVFYIKGAKKITEIMKRLGIKKAILKSGSPACGMGLIYDGTFSKRLKASDGVLTAMLKINGIKIYDEKTKKYS